MSNSSSKLNLYLQSIEGLPSKIQKIKEGTIAKIVPTVVLGLLPAIGQISLVSAQCQGVQASNLVLPQAGSNPGLNIDVDGDGTDDFKIFDNGNAPYFASLHMQALNGGAVLTMGGYGTVKNYAANQVINGNAVNTYGGFWWLVYLNPANTQMIGPWGPDSGGGYPTTGYIGILQGGNYGFIQLEIVSGPEIGSTGADFVINVSDAGLENGTVSGDVQAGVCSTLPIELKSFNATLVSSNSISLNWETALEENNAGFEIMRSIDGRNFEPIEFVASIGNSTIDNRYTYEDKDLKKGNTFYYKLKQIDFDGSFSFSEIVSQQIRQETNISQFYPNPVNSNVTMIDFDFQFKSSESKISIYDITGKLISSENRSIQKGISTQNFDLSNISSGTYFFKFENKEETFYRKLIVQ